jgi:hypothetical protein
MPSDPTYRLNEDRLAFVVLHLLPHGQRLATQVVTVECDEVERIEEHPTILAALALAVERRQAVLITTNRLPSMMQDRERRRARASTMSRKRGVRSLPGRL